MEAETKRLKYDQDWQSEILTCPKCGWQGTFEEGQNECFETLMDCSCPDCDWLESPMLAIVSYPVPKNHESDWTRWGFADDEGNEATDNKD